ncbi:hypothetical protein [Nocardia gipuzkoensis]|uniref:hypothetical protein n=1 Tax=Nocardia gipuzkoensis TaxID=2749991 RepID=UPI003EE2B8FF
MSLPPSHHRSREIGIRSDSGARTEAELLAESLGMPVECLEDETSFVSALLSTLSL